MDLATHERWNKRAHNTHPGFHSEPMPLMFVERVKRTGLDKVEVSSFKIFKCPFAFETVNRFKMILVAPYLVQPRFQNGISEVTPMPSSLWSRR